MNVWKHVHVAGKLGTHTYTGTCSCVQTHKCTCTHACIRVNKNDTSKRLAISAVTDHNYLTITLPGILLLIPTLCPNNRSAHPCRRLKTVVIKHCINTASLSIPLNGIWLSCLMCWVSKEVCLLKKIKLSGSLPSCSVSCWLWGSSVATDWPLPCERQALILLRSL